MMHSCYHPPSAGTSQIHRGIDWKTHQSETSAEWRHLRFISSWDHKPSYEHSCIAVHMGGNIWVSCCLAKLKREKTSEQGKKARNQEVSESKRGCGHPLVGQWGSGQCNQLLTFSLNHFCVTSDWSKLDCTDGYEKGKSGNKNLKVQKVREIFL